MQKRKTARERRTLLADVMAFCERTGMKTSMFGVYAINSSSLYSQLLSGRTVRESTFNKVHEFMRKYEEGKDE